MSYPIEGLNWGARLKRLLWVDDHAEEIHDMIKKIDKDPDFDCDNCYTASEAIAALRSGVVDILLVDVMFGNGDAPQELHEYLDDLKLEQDGIIIGPALVLWVRKNFPKVIVCIATFFPTSMESPELNVTSDERFKEVSLLDKGELRDKLEAQMNIWRR